MTNLEGKCEDYVSEVMEDDERVANFFAGIVITTLSICAWIGGYAIYEVGKDILEAYR